jgi:hypothetical protein
VTVAVAAGAIGGARAAVPALPSIYVNYTTTCSFTMTADGGISFTPGSGPTLPPGTYQVLISMLNLADGYVGCRPRFALSGPGVSSVTEFGGEELHVERVVVLQAASTYVAEDTGTPSTRRVFTTSPSGSSSGLLGTGGGGSQGGNSKGTVQRDLVGSAIVPYRGKLLATVGRAGKASLERGGKRVASLKVGRYDIRVDDAAARAGFFVQRRSRKAVTVTTLPFVGRRTERVTLTPGKWTFFSKVGRATEFTVVP